MQKSLNFINKWFKENGLKIGAMKNENSFCYDHLEEEMEDIIEMKSSTKFLGVTLDSKLTWNEHISSQCNEGKLLVLHGGSVNPKYVQIIFRHSLSVAPKAK